MRQSKQTERFLTVMAKAIDSTPALKVGPRFTMKDDAIVTVRGKRRVVDTTYFRTQSWCEVRTD